MISEQTVGVSFITSSRHRCSWNHTCHSCWWSLSASCMARISARRTWPNREVSTFTFCTYSLKTSKQWRFWICQSLSTRTTEQSAGDRKVGGVTCDNCTCGGRTDLLLYSYHGHLSRALVKTYLLQQQVFLQKCFFQWAALLYLVSQNKNSQKTSKAKIIYTDTRVSADSISSISSILAMVDWSWIAWADVESDSDSSCSSFFADRSSGLVVLPLKPLWSWSLSAWFSACVSAWFLSNVCALGNIEAAGVSCDSSAAGLNRAGLLNQMG